MANHYGGLRYIDGYFPDTSHTNTNHGWNHDSQFLVRLPAKWNSGLVVAGSPGVRAQYANDRAISDYVLSRGYAFAATDKGNTGANFFTDGVKPGDAIVEWNQRTAQLTRAARAVVAQRYGRAPREVVAAGISNGGYLVRWQLENHPELYTRGVDLEGTLWTADGPNLLTFLPPAIKGYQQQSWSGGRGVRRCTRTSGSRQATMSTDSSTPTPTGWSRWFPFSSRQSRARTPWRGGRRTVPARRSPGPGW